MAIILRKKAPFYCRTQDAAGKFTCLLALTDADGDRCPACAAHRAYRAAETMDLLPEPVAAAAVVDEANWRPSGRTGPIWPGAGECAFCEDRAEMNVVGPRAGELIPVCASHIDDYRKPADQGQSLPEDVRSPESAESTSSKEVA